MSLPKFIQIELNHFKKLNSSAQKLMISTFFYYLASPLLFIFINTFIWRKTSSFAAVGAYTFGYFFTIPLFFFLNAFLLKKFQMKHLFMVGLVGQGVVASLAFFLDKIDFVTIFGIGLLLGIPMGLYWANRNFITLEVTHDEERNYFASLETAILTLCNLVVPIFLGWTIVLGDHFHIYTVTEAYQFSIMVVIILLVIAGWVFQSAEIKNPVIQRVMIKKSSRSWMIARATEFFYGFFDRFANVLPPLIVVTLMGNEATLGTIQSALALVIAVVVYLVGRKAETHHRLLILIISMAIFGVGSLVYSFSNSFFSALFFLAILAMTDNLSYPALNSFQMKVIDDEENGDAANNYAYVVDREVFLNLGRMAGMLIFFGLISVFSQEKALHYLPLIVTVTQIFVIILVTLNVRRSKHGVLPV